MDKPNWDRELEVAVRLAREAGEAIRALYESASAETYVKADGSPVTDADLASDRIIRAGLGAAFPEDAILTEEGADDAARLSRSRVWIVDPIDGTQQFVDRTGEFDVLIALAVDGAPVVGVMLQPTTGLYLAAVAGAGAWVGQGDERRVARFAPVPPGTPPRLLTSTWFNRPGSLEKVNAAACRLGVAAPAVATTGLVVRSFLPPGNRFDALIGLPTVERPTMAWEWDFAAADIVMHEAGGRFTDAWGNRFVYNKALARNIGGVVLSVDPVTHARVLDAIRPELPAMP